MPIDKYSGWYSMSPVPTETVVLSLPNMMGTHIAPLLLTGSLAYIISCIIVRLVQIHTGCLLKVTQ